MTFYKFLNPKGRCVYTNGVWHLPENGKPGRWMPKTGPVEECKCGYHIVNKSHLIHWLAPELYEVETRGGVTIYGDKCAVRQARVIKRVESWNEKTAALFAADCAEAVLHIFESKFPNDYRVRECIDATRGFVHGDVTQADLHFARAAAWDAARAAARAAAWDAERDFQTVLLWQYLGIDNN